MSAREKSLRRQWKKIGIVLVGMGLAGGLHIGELEALFEWLEEMNLLDRLAYVQGISSGGLTGSSFSVAQKPGDLRPCLRKGKAIWRDIDRAGPGAIFSLNELVEKFVGTHLPEVLKAWQEYGFGLKFLRNIRGVDFEKTHDAMGELEKIINREGLLSNESLRRLLVDYRPELALTSFFQFEVTAFNGKTGKVELLSPQTFKDDPPLFTDGLISTATILPFFPPVVIRGIPYWDSRCMSESAPDLLSCDAVFVLFAHPRDFVPASPIEELHKKGLPRILGNIVFQDSVLFTELDRLKFENLQMNLSGRGGMAVAIYTPKAQTLSALNLKPGDLDEGMETAKKVSRRTLENLSL